MLGIAIKDKDGTINYVTKLKKGLAETSKHKFEAMTFYSIDELKYHYNQSMGRKCLISGVPVDYAPFVVTL